VSTTSCSCQNPGLTMPPRAPTSILGPQTWQGMPREHAEQHCIGRTESRKQGTENREQRTENREENREQRTENREERTENREQHCIGSMLSSTAYSGCGQALHCHKFQLLHLFGLARALTHSVLGDQILPPPFFSHQWLNYDPIPTPEPESGGNLSPSMLFGTHVTVSGQKWPKMPPKMALAHLFTFITAEVLICCLSLPCMLSLLKFLRDKNSWTSSLKQPLYGWADLRHGISYTSIIYRICL